MRVLFAIFALATSGLAMNPAFAAEVTAVNTLMRGAIIGSGDVRVSASPYENASEIKARYVGMQTSRTIYAGHTLNTSSVQAPSLVKRNRTVTMIYELGGLTIKTYGRALGEGAKGELVEVMNMDSKEKVMGIVTGADMVTVR